MWRILEKAKRPWPVLDDDDVIDYMILEAITYKVAKEEEKEAEDRKKKEWKSDFSELRKVVNG